MWKSTARSDIAFAAAPLPASTDVAVIGGGYTGLCAARALARSGAAVVLLERGEIGSGASGLNGGFVLPGYKADLQTLHRRYGGVRSRELFEASLAAIAFVDRVIREESIECHWHRPGSIVLAARPSHRKDLAAEQRLLAREYGHATTLLGPADLRAEIGTSFYHGGLLDPTAGALHPMEYLVGLGRAAQRAGVVIRSGTGVTALRRLPTGFEVVSTAGTVRARQVVVATNGYTGRLVPWLARRVVPVGSFIIATAPLDPALLARLLPQRRVMSDTRNLLYYFRVSPDGRLVFGGRAAFRAEALSRSLAMLRKGLGTIFPELADVPLEFGWGGTLGFTRDHLPHVGLHQGIAYALGYGGHGVALASALGDQLGQALAGTAPWPVLSQYAFPAVPLYRGWPWFLPLAGLYYGMKDRFDW